MGLNRATAKTVIKSAKYNENMSNLELGWIKSDETWEFLSVDDPTGVITVPAGATSKYSIGMRISFVNAGNTIYGIITAVTSTTITFLHEIDPTDSQALHLMANSAITLPFFSTQKAPFGFPLDPDKWSVKATSASKTAQTTPTQNVWYNQLSIDIPIGVWNTKYKGIFSAFDSNAASVYILSTLSSGSSTETNTEFSVRNGMRSDGGTRTDIFIGAEVVDKIAATSKTSYYLNILSPGSGVDEISIRGNLAPTIIRAVSAYL